MKLAELFSKNAVILELAAKDKKTAIKELAQWLKTPYKFKPATIKDVVTKIEAREKAGTTGIGGAVALPHAKLEGISQICGVFARSAAGIDFDAVDGEKVKLFFLVIAPVDMQEEYLDSIKKISLAVRKPNVVKFLQQAKGINEIMELFLEMDDLVKS